MQLGQLALGLPCGAAAVLKVQVLHAPACFLLVLVRSEKLVLQHPGKWTCEEKHPDAASHCLMSTNCRHCKTS